MEKKRNLFWVMLITFLFFWVTGEGMAQQLTVNVGGGGSGTVASSPAGINCGGDCSEVYSQGKSITLKAKANPDSYFVGWSGGGCTGAKTCKVTMDSDVVVIATFEIKTPEISVSPETLDFGTVQVGEKKTLALKIANTGMADLVVTATVEGQNSDFTITGANGNDIPPGVVVLSNDQSKTMTIKPKGSKNLKVTLSPKSAAKVNTIRDLTSGGSNQSSVNLTSNDPKHPKIEVPVEEDLVAPLNHAISYMTVDEVAEELQIVGNFYDRGDAGKVTIGGKEAGVKQWTTSLIVCALPVFGLDGVGDVQVVSGNGTKSNVVPLTMWEGQFRYTFICVGPLKLEMTCDVHIRADIHPLKVNGKVFWPVVPFQGSRDSKCHYEASGSYTWPTNVVESWSNYPGSDTIPITMPPDQVTIPTNEFVLDGSIDSNQKKMHLRIDVTSSGFKLTEEDLNLGTTDSIPRPFSTFSEVYDDLGPTGPAFNLNLDNEFNIKADSRGPVTTWVFTDEFEWDTIPASFPPKN